MKSRAGQVSSWGWMVMACLGLIAADSVANAATAEFRFAVLLNGDRIGEHRFVIKEEDGRKLVESEAAFDVKILFINAYRYRHESREIWSDGCLRELEAWTDDNGTRYAVEGKGMGDGFVVDNGETTWTTTSDCVMTFAYWDPRFLDQERLLNVQTGKLMNVRVQRGQTSLLPAGDADVPATGYQLGAEGVNLTVWYTDDGRWVGLDSVMEGGDHVRYRTF